MGQRLILTTKRTKDTKDFRGLDTGSFFVSFVPFVVDFDAGADDLPADSVGFLEQRVQGGDSAEGNERRLIAAGRPGPARPAS
jgi:hypothetical protein